MKEFFLLLGENGCVEIRVPDVEYIIKSWRISMEKKLTYLYGGQDIAQRHDIAMDVSRKMHPQFFCHKFGWTRRSMEEELIEIGFKKVTTKRFGTNFVAYGKK